MAEVDPFDAAIDAALKGGAAPAAAPVSAPAQAAPVSASSSADPFDSAIDDALAGKITAPSAASKSKQIRLPLPPSQVTDDIERSGAQGVINGTIGALTTPRTLRDLAATGQNWLMAHGAHVLGLLPEGKTAEELYHDLNGLDAQSAGKGIEEGLLPSYQGAQKGLTAAGFPEYQPKSVPGDYAKTVGEFLPFAGRSIVAGAIAPGIASETAGKLTEGTAFEPYARFGGAVLGGVGAGMAGPAISKAVDSAKLAVEPHINPEAAAAREFAARVPNIDDVDRATSPGPMRPGEVPQYDPVAGVVPTTGAMTNNPELLQMERQIRTGSDPAAISSLVQQDQANAAARTAALSGVQQTGAPAEVAARFRQLRDEADAQRQAAVDAMAPAADITDAAAGGRGNAETIGGAIRQPVEDARAAAKTNENKLWGLVRNDLSVPSTGISDAANGVKGELSPSARPMTGEEARIFDVASGYGPATLFSELRDLRSAITDATAEARQAGNTQTARRLGILRTSLDDALDHGIENQAALDAVAVGRGTMAPEQTIGAQLNQFQSAGGSGRSRSSIPPPSYAPEPQDLIGFLKSQGGLAPNSELDAMELGKRFPGLIKPNGMKLDHAREGAAEAGYFGADTDRHVADTTVNDLLDALDSDGKVYSQLDEGQLADHHNYQAYRERNADYKKAQDAILTWTKETGEPTPNAATLRRAARIMVDDGQTWDNALESAHIQHVEGARDAEILRGRSQGNGQGSSQEGASGNGHGPEGGPIPNGQNQRFTGQSGQAPAGSHFFETARPEDIANYNAAKAATRERAQTFDEGLPGDILKPASRGGYKTVDAGVIDKVVPAGKNDGATKVEQYLAAGGDPAALAEGIAFKLRKDSSYPDGTLNPAKVNAFLNNPANRQALAKLPPEYAARFKTAAAAREAVDQLKAAQVQAAKDFNASAIGRVAGVQDGADVVKHIGSIFGSSNAVQKMRELATAAASDPAAKEGLRRAIIEHMENRLTSHLEGNAVKANTYLGFVKDNRAALAQVFTPQEMERFAAISRSLDTAGRIHSTKGLTSSPGTAQDAASNQAKEPTIFNRIMGEAGPAMAAGAAHMAGFGEAASAGAYFIPKTIARLKAAGLAKRDAIMAQAVADPHFFRAVMAKMPPKPGQGSEAALSHYLAVIASRAAAGDLNAQQGR